MQTDTRSAGSVFVDHYAVLGLDLSASARDIKASFRRLAKRHHPDVVGGDALRFLEIYAAYRVLGDDASRNRYNAQYLQQLRSASQPAEASGRPPDRIDIPSGRLVYPGNVAEMARRGLLRHRFGRVHRRWMYRIDYDIELPLTDAELGARLQVNIPVVARTLCPDCRGSNVHCSACDGRGSYKNTRTIKLGLDGGLVDGQILEIPLGRLRLESLSHFKKKRLRIRISRYTPALSGGRTRASIA